MNELSDTKRQVIASAQQVMMLLFLNPSTTIQEACKEVGITERQYRYWLTHGENAIEVTRNLIDQQQRQFISEIAIAKALILKQLILDAKDTLTKPLERAKLFEILNEELNQLQSIYNVRPGIEEQAQAYLKEGPKIEKKTSRFASIDIEETESGFRVGINEEKDVVDGDFTDSQNHV